MNKSDIKYISLIAPLLYIYQNIFLWSKNISIFTHSQLLYSFGAILLLSALCYVIFYYVFSVINAKIQSTKWLQFGIGVFVAVFIGIISNFFFLRTIFYPHNHLVMYMIMIGIIFIIYFNVSKYFIKFCYVLILFAVCTFTFNMYKDTAVAVDDTDKFLIEFKDKPNIYMLWLESYHGTRMLNDVYHVDISSLITFLEKNNFTVCENIYSSSSYTLASMVDLFSLGKINSNDYAVGNLDLLSSLRNLIGGGTGNNLLKVLKYNNYITNSLLASRAYFNEKGKYLDYAPIVDMYNNYSIKFFPCYAFSKKANESLSIILGHQQDEEQKSNKDEYYFLPLVKKLELTIDKTKQMDNPYFVYMKYDGTHHTDTFEPYKDADRLKWIESGMYKKEVEKSISELQEIISLIVKKDPNALIVMLGDHGAWSYRELLLDELSIKNVTLNEFVDDKFNVFGAVRLPEKYAKFSFDDSEIYINHSNIFVHIFSLLAQNPEYLNLQEIPVSNFFNKKDLVVNGTVNENLGF